MHIITGMLIAALAGRKKKTGRTPVSHLPRVRIGPVQTVHALPGRIRFRVPSLAGDRPNKQMLEAQLPRISGIESAEASEVTGSVLIRYREGDLHPDVLFAALIRLMGLEDALDQPPRPIVAKELQLMGNSLNRAFFEKSGGIIDLWSAFFLLMAALGIRKILSQKGFSLPAGFTMLWWALNGFSKRKVE
jgi:hypothetical protein